MPWSQISDSLAPGRPIIESTDRDRDGSGTPAYMSPEQASGERHLDGRSDVYSLACVLYEMLVGEPPYTGPTAQAITAKQFSGPVPSARRVRHSVPQEVDVVLRRGLAPLPADRFSTAKEFAEALTAAWRAPVADRRKRRPILAGLVLLTLAIVGVVWYRSTKQQRVMSSQAGSPNNSSSGPSVY